MPAGLEVFGPNGASRLAITGRIGRIVATFQAASSGSQSVPLLAGGSPFAFGVLNSNSPTNSGFAVVNVSGTIVSWATAEPGDVLTIICGVY